MIVCRYHHLNAVKKVVPDLAHIEKIRHRFMSLKGIFNLKDFVSGWFFGRPWDELRLSNLHSFAAYSLFSAEMSDLQPQVMSPLLLGLPSLLVYLLATSIAVCLSRCLSSLPLFIVSCRLTDQEALANALGTIIQQMVLPQSISKDSLLISLTSSGTWPGLATIMAAS